ncbi:MAG TPA: M23 family metallopeptidase [Candidatus Dormibacteraeota bacterium]|jgi:murein DD-endopeptidase MepM/ murein hydrolase activator NlpD|nr:M23 family metallopeptidase [Candidatus Dormibacteraeota bacterium]
MLVSAAGLALAGGAVVGTGALSLHGSASALAPVVDAGAAGVSIDDAPDHSAVVHAPAGTAVRAVAGGAVVMPAVAALSVHGAAEDAGVEVGYTGLAAVSAVVSVQRGDAVGQVPDAGVVTVRVTLDGAVLDAGPLLRAARSGNPADAAGAWVRPVDGAVVSQSFGCSPYSMEPVDRGCPSGHIHTGIDLAVPAGTPVRASLDGVATVVVSAAGYGLHVVVDSGDGLTTLYAHMESVAVHDGDAVAAGDVVGLAGSTGNSTGPHLHFEVRRDGIPEDPTLDLALP